MSDYYNNLYDVNFFSEEKYQNKLHGINIQVINPGYVLWDSWKKLHLTINEAKSFYEKDFLDVKELHSQFKKCPEEQAVLILLICEEAYRKDNESLFLQSYLILSKSSFKTIRLKALKLLKAYNALKLLSEKLNYDSSYSLTRIEKIQNHSLSYLNKSLGNNFLDEDIRVEVPVKRDWQNRNMNFLDINCLEDFYKTTPSYVLELIAANHQVETLFNYSLVIDKLKELGITELYDYAGGIGTFVILAKLKGVKVVFSELNSVTRNYANKRFEDLGINITSNILEYDKPDLNSKQNCIVCTEVLEHIFEPEELVNYFYKNLNRGGILIVSESFDYTDNFCSHLPKHKGKGGINFIKYMEEVGFKLIPLKYPTHPKLFQKI